MILRFFQRWAMLFAILAGSIIHRTVLPEHLPLWLEYGVTLVSTGLVYLVLHKDGVTTNRPPKRPKRTVSR